ncbi:protein Wnt-8b-like [Anoplophora glabripennis]|uniref:protein Wnt-8b-like n=1 Tax=Anoplophora glabripennis TaxID=217634 RepID=UPI0008752E1C|nr:protein Wnt-8b-like [Anoplophora glabripennis]
MCDCSPLWPANNSLYKANSIVPIPIGVTPTVADSIEKGAELALEFCKSVFKWDKWNCPRSFFLRLPKQQPNRETAFSKAILSAGIVHRITRDCSKGDITECGCDPDIGPPSVLTSSSLKLHTSSLLYNSTQKVEEHRSGWTWGGCSDDPRYALEVSKKFLSNLEKGNDAAAYVGRHNNNVGAQVIRDSMVKKCRCHGVSGSCSVQTCWMQVASFGEVTKRLREKYKRAERLSYETVEVSITLGNSARELAKEKVIPIKRNSLVYLVQSPDYCVANKTEDFPGTRGRKCSRNASKLASPAEKKSCRTLCRGCGYKVKKIKKKETQTCNCNFVWCCEVKCETCVVDVEEYFCY